MGTEPLPKLLLAFSGPAMVAMASGALYNVVDAIFVGRLGSDALAAVTVAFPAMMIVFALATGVGIGGASAIARALGADDRGRARRVCGNTILMVIFWGILTPLAAIPLADPILRLCGASDDVLQLSRPYLRILMATSCVTYFIVVINNVIRAEGNAMLPMAAQVTSSVINIVLNPLFIFTLGMGIEGAAWATVVARSIGLLIQLIYLLSPRTHIRPRWRHMAPDVGIWIETYRVGFASIARNGIQAGIIAFATSIAAGFGDLAVAAIGIVFRLQMFVMMPCFGLTQGFLPLVGFNFGAGKMDRVRRVTILAASWATAVTTVAFVLFVGIPHILVRPFAPDPELAELAARALRLVSLGLAPAGGVVLFSAFFQGIGRGFPALVLSSSRQLLFFVPALLVLPRIMDLDGLFLAQPFADLLSLALSVAWITYQFRQLGIPLFARR